MAFFLLSQALVGWRQAQYLKMEARAMQDEVESTRAKNRVVEGSLGETRGKMFARSLRM